MKIQQHKVAFESRQLAGVQNMIERPAALAHFFADRVAAKRRMTGQIAARVNGAEQHVGRFALAVSPNGQVT